ncbi:hypothetical protein J6590_107673, partial [Homalodisca vitripennis]
THPWHNATNRQGPDATIRNYGTAKTVSDVKEGGGGNKIKCTRVIYYSKYWTSSAKWTGLWHAKARA